MSIMSKILKNTLVITLISAMMITSCFTMSFAAEEVSEAEPFVKPEDCVSLLTAVDIVGEPIESEIVYYLNIEGQVVRADGTIADLQINADGFVVDAEGIAVNEIVDTEGTVIKTQLDAEGNPVSPLVDAEGVITSDNGEVVEYAKAYVIDEEGSLATNNVYVVTKDGQIIGSIIGFFMDEDKNVVDVDGNIVIAAPEEVAAQSEEIAPTSLQNDEEALEPVTEEVAGEAADENAEVAAEENAEAEEATVVEENVEEAAEAADDDEEVLDTPKAGATAAGWKTVNGKQMYYYSATSFYKNTLATIDGKTYAFDSNGYLVVNNFFTFNGQKYATNASGALQAGVFAYGTTYYYADPSTNVISTKTGFFVWNSTKYYMKSNGTLARNESFKVSGKKYIAGTGANIRAGVFSYSGKYYYANPSGNAVKTSKGWVKWNNNWYYAKSDGTLYTSTFKTIKNHKYYFQADGSAAKGKVFGTSKGYFYAHPSCYVKTSKGWVKWNDNWYYVRKGGKIYNNTQFTVKGKKYTALPGGGAMATGIYLWNGNYYYSNASTGQLRTAAGLITVYGRSYYVQTGGKLLKNKLKTANSKKYYFGADAAAKVGTFTVGNVKYTANSTGQITSTENIVKKGIDVSYAQGTIDWKKVKATGIDFAIIRIGYSGASTGKCMEDDWFRTNIKGAKAAGLKVGVYYYTTAMTEKEALAEANFTTNLIKSVGYSLDLPVVIDSEALPSSLSRDGTRGKKYNNIDRTTRTNCVKAFCNQVKSNGYTPMIYASTSWLNNKLYMSQLSGFKVWVAQYNDYVTYNGSYQCWQYTSSGRVSGISGNVDMNNWYGDYK